MSTNEILNQIDSALNDWSVSPDAMRSRPVDEAHSGKTTLGSAVADWADESLGPDFRLDDWQRAVLERLYQRPDRVRTPIALGFDGSRNGGPCSVAVTDADGHMAVEIWDEVQLWQPEATRVARRLWLNGLVETSPLLWEGDQA